MQSHGGVQLKEANYGAFFSKGALVLALLS